MANEKILIADDDKNICELLRLYLATVSYTHLDVYKRQELQA